MSCNAFISYAIIAFVTTVINIKIKKYNDNNKIL